MTVTAATLMATLLGLLGVGYAAWPLRGRGPPVAPDAATLEESAPGDEAGEQLEALRAWAVASGEVGRGVADRTE